MFFLTQMALRNYQENSGRPVMIWGPWGVGKSSYAIQVLQEIIEQMGNSWDWKELLVFKPKEFLDLTLHLAEKRERAPAIVWDDAGIWLYALDYMDPFVKAMGKFLQLARTVAPLVMFTSPSPDMVIRRIRIMEGFHSGKVIKLYTGPMRRVRIFRYVTNAGGQRFPVEIANDEYNVMLPNEIYNYYKPLREGYVIEALKLVYQSLSQSYIRELDLEREDEDIGQKVARIEKILARIRGDDKR